MDVRLGPSASKLYAFSAVMIILAPLTEIVDRDVHDRMRCFDFQPGLLSRFKGRERVFSLSIHFQLELLKRWFALPDGQIWCGLLNDSCFRQRWSS
jgi:hypothetical protein